MQNIYDKTFAMIRSRQNLTYMQIANESGLSYHWVQKFACGAIKNPTLSRIQKLHDYLLQAENRGPA